MSSKKVVFSSVPSLIDFTKSSRLETIRNLVRTQSQKEIKKKAFYKTQLTVEAVKESILLRIAEIKSTYPSNMKNKLFILRYGSDEILNEMSLKKIISVLKIEVDLSSDLEKIIYRELFL